MTIGDNPLRACTLKLHRVVGSCAIILFFQFSYYFSYSEKFGFSDYCKFKGRTYLFVKFLFFLKNGLFKITGTPRLTG